MPSHEPVQVDPIQINQDVSPSQTTRAAAKPSTISTVGFWWTVQALWITPPALRDALGATILLRHSSTPKTSYLRQLGDVLVVITLSLVKSWFARTKYEEAHL